MDLCASFLLLGFILFLVALLGHGLWLLGSAIVRAIAGVPEPPKPGQGRRLCPACGTRFGGGLGVCPACGLNYHGNVAGELRELEAAARQIQYLVENEFLDRALGEQVYQGIEARQAKLLQEEPGSSGDAAFPEIPFLRDPATRFFPPWERLDRVLSSCPDVRDMSLLQRKQALAWYKQLTEEGLALLSAPSLAPLARLLRMAGFTTRAMQIYALLLARYPQAEETGRAALEAGGFAFKENQPELARKFLQLALTQPLPEQDRQTVLKLLATLPGETFEPTAALKAENAVPALIPTVVEEAAPRRSWGQMLAGFMEERNILWGELVGGLLIVGCSIALVISLWRTLEQIPYFPFLIFAAITAVLFGAGLYTLSHWKLEATSRGLLVIATLLTPLDFLVLAGLARGHEAGLMDWGTELLAVVCFTALVRRSGRILVWQGDWLLTLAVIGAAATQLLVPRWLDAAQPVLWFFVLLSLAPVVVQALALGWAVLGLARQGPLDCARANKVFLFLGMSTFAVVVALGFIVFWSDDVVRTIRHLAVSIAVAAMPLLVCGAFVQHGLAGIQPPPAPASQGGEGESAAVGARGLSLAVAALVGTVIALLGSGIMVAALGLAWPRPVALVLIGGLNAAVFAGVALGFRLPYVHGPALACLAIGFLTAFHGLGGELAGDEAIMGSRLLALAVTPSSGSALAILAVVLAVTSEMLGRARRRIDGIYHVLGSGLAGLAAMLLVSFEGDTQPGRAALVFGVCGLGGGLVNVRWRRPWFSILASFTLLGFIAYTIHWWDPALSYSRLWVLALLSHATFMLLAGAICRSGLPSRTGAALSSDWASWPGPARLAGPTNPFLGVGFATSLLALAPLLSATEWEWLPQCALSSLWLAGLWLVLAWGWVSPGLFAAFQAAVAMAVLFGVSGWLHRQDWVGEQARQLLHYRSLQTYGLGLACLGLVWALLRLGLRSRGESRAGSARRTYSGRVSALLEPGWRGFDWAVLATVITGQFVLAAVALWPEILREVIPLQGHREILGVFAGLPQLDLPLAWNTLGVLATVLLVSLWGSRPRDTVLGLVLWALTLAGVAAYQGHTELAAASRLRWGLALVFFGGSGLSWARANLRRWGERLGITWSADWNVARWGRGVLLTGALVPVLLVTTMVALVGFYGRQPAGPGADTFFAWLGWTANIVVPLLLLVVGLTGNGMRENAAGYLFSAGLVLLATVTGGYALGVVTGGGTLDARESVFLMQLGVLAVSLWALAWLGSGRWRHGLLLAIQAALGLAAVFSLLIPALVEVLVHGGGPWTAWVTQTGTWPGWVGLATTMAAMIWVLRIWRPELSIHVLAGGGLGVGILAACVAARSELSGWLAYHVLTLAWTGLALLVLVISWAGSTLDGIGPIYWGPERRQRAVATLGQFFPVASARRWVETIGLGVVLLALGGAWGDPGRPYWSCAATLAVSVLIGALAVWAPRPAYVYASGLLLNVVAYLVWQAWLVDRWDLLVWFVLGPELFDHFLLLQILALAVAALVWLLVENRLRHREPPVDLRSNAIPFAHAAVLLAVHLLAVLALAGLGGDLFQLEIHVQGSFPWLVLSVTALALVACLWDPEASALGLPLAPLYVLGLAACGLALHQRVLSPRELGWNASLFLAAYTFAAGFLVWLFPRWLPLVGRLKIAPRSQGWLAGWFVPAQALVALLVVDLSLGMCLDFPTVAERLAGPLALALIVVAGWMMDSRWPSMVEAMTAPMLRDVRGPVLVTLGLSVLTLVEGCWALLDPAVPAPWLHRNVLVLAVTVVVGMVYRLGLVRWVPRESLWVIQGRRLGEGLLVLAGLVLAVILVQEFFHYDPQLRTTPLAWSGMALVAALLAGIMVSGLWLAVARHKPFGLTERGRTRCVWAAEGVLVLFLVHLRLNVPDLFPTFIGRNWALVLMGLGFVGVGLAEVFQRRGLAALAGPLQQTGLFLPLLPLLAFLVRPLVELNDLGQKIPGLQPIFRYLESERLPHSFALHALLWFLLGLLYTLTALLRRASSFALLAALAANFGLWVIYANHENLRFLLHPQIWLVPVGLILLAAEHLHRARLTGNQAQAVRYACLLAIYLSSTADMFITGLGHSFYLPVVLALLSVAGVLAGILLRVRAFLFLGVAFLFLVVFAQIWHAAVDRAQTWVWWASGIVLGAAILTLFALFEKRRNDVLRMLEEIKRWR